MKSSLPDNSPLCALVPFCLALLILATADRVAHPKGPSVAMWTASGSKSASIRPMVPGLTKESRISG